MLSINKKQSAGFSLIELLVAMVVGLIIITGVFSLHSATRKIQVASEAQMDMVADARFAIEMIAYDLRHAGMWGGTNKSGLVTCRSSDDSCSTSSAGEKTPDDVVVLNDCNGGDWYNNLDQPIFATDGSVGNPYSASCIPTTEEYLAGTDILEIRYADSNSPVGLLANQAYVRSNFLSGRVFIGKTAPSLDAYETSPLTENHALHAYAYYIGNYSDVTGDGVPSLRRAALVNGPTVQNQLMISGVINLQVKFGEDVDGDEIVDRYVDPQNVIDWTAVYAAKIWLVMRSDNVQKGINTKKTFDIAGTSTDLGGADGFRHFVVSSVVNLRNLKQL